MTKNIKRKRACFNRVKKIKCQLNILCPLIVILIITVMNLLNLQLNTKIKGIQLEKDQSILPCKDCLIIRRNQEESHDDHLLPNTYRVKMKIGLQMVIKTNH